MNRGRETNKEKIVSVQVMGNDHLSWGGVRKEFEGGMGKVK